MAMPTGKRVKKNLRDILTELIHEVPRNAILFIGTKSARRYNSDRYGSGKINTDVLTKYYTAPAVYRGISSLSTRAQQFPIWMEQVAKNTRRPICLINVDMDWEYEPALASLVGYCSTKDDIPFSESIERLSGAATERRFANGKISQVAYKHHSSRKDESKKDIQLIISYQVTYYMTTLVSTGTYVLDAIGEYVAHTDISVVVAEMGVPMGCLGKQPMIKLIRPHLKLCTGVPLLVGTVGTERNEDYEPPVVYPTVTYTVEKKAKTTGAASTTPR